MPASLDREAERPVEWGQIVGAQALGLALPQPDSSHSGAVLDLVIERSGIPSDPDHGRQRLEPFARGVVHECRGVQGDPGALEVLP